MGQRKYIIKKPAILYRISLINIYEYLSRVVDFNDKTIVSVNVKPKKGIECKEFNFDIECVKVPFGKEENENYTYEEMVNELIELGFEETNINTKKEKGFFETDDGKVKEAAFSNYTFVSSVDRKESLRV